LTAGVLRYANTGLQRQTHVSRSSMIVYLRDELHGEIDAVRWYAQQEDNIDEGWMSKNEMRTEHKLAPNTVLTALLNGSLAGIRLSKDWRIPRWAVRQYVEVNRLLGAADIAKIFGVPVATAQEWIDNRSLCQLKHNRKACLKQACVIRYITEHRSSDHVDATEWVRRTRFESAVVITAKDAAAGTEGAYDLDVIGAAQAGYLDGV